MTTDDLRCPRCGAHVPAAASWCSLCYADLRTPKPKPAPAPVPAVEPRDTGCAGERDGDVRPQGKHARPAMEAEPRTTARQQARSTKAGEDVERTAAALLAQLAVSESSNPAGRCAGLVDSPAKKVALMAGGAVVAMLVLFILMAVIGTLL